MSPNIMCVRSLTQQCMHSKGGWDVYKLSTRPTCYAHAKSDSSRLKMQLPNYVIENSSNMDVVAGNCMLK